MNSAAARREQAQALEQRLLSAKQHLSSFGSLLSLGRVFEAQKFLIQCREFRRWCLDRGLEDPAVTAYMDRLRAAEARNEEVYHAVLEHAMQRAEASLPPPSLPATARAALGQMQARQQQQQQQQQARGALPLPDAKASRIALSAREVRQRQPPLGRQNSTSAPLLPSLAQQPQPQQQQPQPAVPTPSPIPMSVSSPALTSLPLSSPGTPRASLAGPSSVSVLGSGSGSGSGAGSGLEGAASVPGPAQTVGLALLVDRVQQIGLAQLPDDQGAMRALAGIMEAIRGDQGAAKTLLLKRVNAVTVILNAYTSLAGADRDVAALQTALLNVLQALGEEAGAVCAAEVHKRNGTRLLIGALCAKPSPLQTCPPLAATLLANLALVSKADPQFAVHSRLGGVVPVLREVLDSVSGPAGSGPFPGPQKGPADAMGSAAEVVKYAVGVLSAMVSSENSVGSLVKARVGGSAVRAVVAHYDDLGRVTAKAALAALVALSRKEAGAEAITEAGAVPFLLNRVVAGETQLVVVKAALELLRNLVSIDAGKAALESARGMSILYDRLKDLARLEAERVSLLQATNTTTTTTTTGANQANPLSSKKPPKAKKDIQVPQQPPAPAPPLQRQPSTEEPGGGAPPEEPAAKPKKKKAAKSKKGGGDAESKKKPVVVSGDTIMALLTTVIKRAQSGAELPLPPNETPPVFDVKAAAARLAEAWFDPEEAASAAGEPPSLPPGPDAPPPPYVPLRLRDLDLEEYTYELSRSLPGEETGLHPLVAPQRQGGAALSESSESEDSEMNNFIGSDEDEDDDDDGDVKGNGREDDGGGGGGAAVMTAGSSSEDVTQPSPAALAAAKGKAPATAPSLPRSTSFTVPGKPPLAPLPSVPAPSSSSSSNTKGKKPAGAAKPAKKQASKATSKKAKKKVLSDGGSNDDETSCGAAGSEATAETASGGLFSSVAGASGVGAGPSASVLLPPVLPWRPALAPALPSRAFLDVVGLPLSPQLTPKAPDVMADLPPPQLSEPLLERPADILMTMMDLDLERVLGKLGDGLVVYDSRDSGCLVRARGAAPALPLPMLEFESRFECGNLRRAVRIQPHEYDLVVAPDLNSTHHVQWFYFRVRGLVPGVRYRFNLINMEKAGSQFNEGMRPVLFSELEAQQLGHGWRRVGEQVCYYRNQYQTATGGKCHTLSFQLTHARAGDTVYLAYHFPYTLTRLRRQLDAYQATPAGEARLRRQVLCATLAGNAVELLTITEPASLAHPVERRRVVVLSARVHPGETNSSWMMEGCLDLLLGPSELALQLCQNFVFKVVPMLNPDGVVHGSHRCSLAGVDLNRQYVTPDRALHPEVFHVKQLIRNLVAKGRPPVLYCDFHGHSRKKDIFIFGCNARDHAREQAFPRLLSVLSPVFSFEDCNFKVQKYKEAAARIAIHKEFRIMNSYTMESSYCGASRGLCAGVHFHVSHLKGMGSAFLAALHEYANPAGPSQRVLAILAELDQPRQASKKGGDTGADDD
jgi:hypothetical protein